MIDIFEDSSKDQLKEILMDHQCQIITLEMVRTWIHVGCGIMWIICISMGISYKCCAPKDRRILQSIVHMMLWTIFLLFFRKGNLLWATNNLEGFGIAWGLMILFMVGTFWILIFLNELVWIVSWVLTLLPSRKKYAPYWVELWR